MRMTSRTFYPPIKTDQVNFFPCLCLHFVFFLSSHLDLSLFLADELPNKKKTPEPLEKKERSAKRTPKAEEEEEEIFMETTKGERRMKEREDLGDL